MDTCHSQASWMDCVLRSIFAILECPKIRVKKISWVQLPSRMTVFAFVLSTYFLVTGVSERKPTPEEIRDHQYIMEGLLCSFMFTLGAIGFILLDVVNESKMTKLTRTIMLSLSVACIVVSFVSVRAFMKIKMP
ncbi:Oligosaccharyltransferase complex subunit ostc [Taenia crassiceps]|uniref:Oligosaccharyltransferase complex subunit n=1 Tax=Taenia crassiceps TaxID=6207 RepID=A0ABR4QQW1_9CEST